MSVQSKQKFAILLTGFSSQKEVENWISSYSNSGEQVMAEESNAHDFIGKEPFPWSTSVQKENQFQFGNVQITEIELKNP